MEGERAKARGPVVFVQYAEIFVKMSIWLCRDSLDVSMYSVFVELDW